MKEFETIEDLEAYISNYEKKHFVKLWKRDTRNIESMKKVCPNKLANCNSALVYYNLTYACVRGGRKFKTRTSGIRNSSTVKNDCPMYIKIRLSADGQRLQIAHMNENHNHTIDKSNYSPSLRRLKIERRPVLIDPENLLRIRYTKKYMKYETEHDGDDEHNNSGDSSDEEDVRYARDTNDRQNVHNFYPRWLIEVEKKRAHAELIRAKAEGRRVLVAAKNAEAALLQADALKRLADAASVQAEAVVQIAAALNNRGVGDIEITPHI